MGKRYKLNPGLVLRDSDEAFFDVKKFKIYKFNKKGYQLLLLLKDINDVDEWEQKATSTNLVTAEQFHQFIQKCEEYAVITPQSPSLGCHIF